ncbi:hypothetical protein LOC68_00480 [Blastopirellula sp. JC732]|uniref:Uncharacterized protein n=1 Tax=Blastopirellula sediminis TaxID=2894196 RepID=A0A9X1MJZ8_9BACT|nr:hypothetical protein [Blastopirellula sediminis]MCC9604349.1 hypothetical protein [Blastopirellula sediminis]MCC9626869.1 hypothetical protein [Blastopirellula sediminis]
MIRTLLIPAVLLSLVATFGTAKAASTEPSCCAPEPVSCCEPPCITYRDHHRLFSKVCCCSCEPPVKMVLVVEKPCTDCAFEVPVCVPACCTDAPKVCAHDGIFGRKVVEYEWCCGFHIRMVFTHCGDLIVHSYY